MAPLRFKLEDGTPMMAAPELDISGWCGCEGCMGNTKIADHPAGLEPTGNCHSLPNNCTSRRSPTGQALIYIREADLVAYLEVAQTLGVPT